MEGRLDDYPTVSLFSFLGGRGAVERMLVQVPLFQGKKIDTKAVAKLLLSAFVSVASLFLRRFDLLSTWLGQQRSCHTFYFGG